jgi:purine nucleosidase
MKNIDILGITVTPADCYLENAVETTLKILKKAKKNDIEIGIGHHFGINAFPSSWRAKPKILNALPDLIGIETKFDLIDFKSSSDLIIEKIINSEKPVTILMTGPCSNLVHAIEKNPEIIDNIEEIIWMAGAFDVPGNVKTYNQDGSAEWNVFWDPLSSNSLLKYKIPTIFIPLDVTNYVPVSLDFLKTLALQSNYFWSNLASQFWATTLDTIPSYEYIYFMWDVMATSYLSIPEAFELTEMEIDIHTSGPMAGKTCKCKGSNNLVRIAINVNKDMFYNHLLESFADSF